MPVTVQRLWVNDNLLYCLMASDDADKVRGSRNPPSDLPMMVYMAAEILPTC